MTPADHRDAVINGRLDLAAFLESNPAIPAPYSVRVHHFPDHGTDDEMRTEVDKVASLLGGEASVPENSYGHYQTCVTFGPIEYKAVAILAAARAQHAADSSYDGCITPTQRRTP